MSWGTRTERKDQPECLVASVRAAVFAALMSSNRHLRHQPYFKWELQ